MPDSSKILRNRGWAWEGVEAKDYKTEATHFKSIRRHTLLGDAPDESALSSILRYFEIQPGGYSTLERHQHPHAVVVIRGRGRVILGGRVEDVGLLDCVYIAPNTFHQFHATSEEPLGFLCIVDQDRDRPVLPSPDDIDQLSRNPSVAALIKT